MPIHFYCFSHPVCDMLLWQPGQTNTMSMHVITFHRLHEECDNLANLKTKT